MRIGRSEGGKRRVRERAKLCNMDRGDRRY